MTIFSTKISLASLPLAQGEVKYIGETALDPMDTLLHGPTFPVRMPLEGAEPYTNMQIPIGIRIPPTPTRLQASQECTL